DQHGEFAVGNFEVDPAHGLHRAVVLVEAADLQVCHGSFLLRGQPPCTAPSVRPRTRCRCTSMPSAMDGTREMTARALASPYCEAWNPRKARKTVGSVKASREVRIRAKKNSVQQK